MIPENINVDISSAVWAHINKCQRFPKRVHAVIRFGSSYERITTNPNDVDLQIIWSTKPSKNTRKAAAEECGLINPVYKETHIDAKDLFEIAGKKFDLVHVNRGDLYAAIRCAALGQRNHNRYGRLIDRALGQRNHNRYGRLIDRLYRIENCQIIYDPADTVGKLRKKMRPFPNALRKAIIADNKDLIEQLLGLLPLAIEKRSLAEAFRYMSQLMQAYLRLELARKEIYYTGDKWLAERCRQHELNPKFIGLINEISKSMSWSSIANAVEKMEMIWLDDTTA